MQNRTRLTNLLIAGTLTVLLLVVFLAFRGGDTSASASEDTGQTAVSELADEDTADIAALQTQIESLQAQIAAYTARNEELRTAVKTFQEREIEYQNQIEAANQTINELSTQNGNLAAGPGWDTFPTRPREHEH